MTTASWIIRRKSDGYVVMETFNPEAVARLCDQRYEAVPILDYLQEINRKIRAAACGYIPMPCR